ncbi:MAG: PQQ-dependent sugar dehydrogenase [Methanobacteriota archaeon]
MGTRGIAALAAVMIVALAVGASTDVAREPDRPDREVWDGGSGDGPEPTAPDPHGVLRVRTDPAVPTTIHVDDVPRDDWALNWMKLDPGGHTVSFSDVPGYSTPPATAVELVADGVAEAIGRFEPRGFLRVVTDPALPATVSVAGVPRDDWGLWTAVPPGAYVVSFGAVAGYRAPAPQTVEVRARETAVVTGRFVFDGLTPGPVPDSFGLLRVFTDPAVPSQVLVDGIPRDDWALNWMELAPGTYTVGFTDVPGYGTPPPQTVSVSAGAITTVRGAFRVHGSLRVTTDPPVPSTIFLDGVPVDDWGVWTSVPPGTHIVSFGPVPGLATPAPREVTVTEGDSTWLEGTFAVAEVWPLDWPTAVAFARDGRTFFAERFTGRIRVIRDGTLLATPFASLPRTATADEQGLLGLALDPDFPTSPWVYAYQTYAPPSGAVYGRILRFLADGDIGGAPETVLERIPAAAFHNGGVIAFGPDGKLYALVGDAGDSEAAQDLRVLNGKTLRMNPDGSVPDDNPFVGAANANPYVYTYGHRNMYGIAFHPVTGRAYLTENGPTDNDEVNVLVPGANYGWPVVRGIANRPEYRDPIIAYTPTIAPTNAAFPPATAFPGFDGDLVFGDWNTGSLRRLDLGPPTYEVVLGQEVLVLAQEGILDVEVGLDEAIRLSTPSTIFRYADTPSPSPAGNDPTAAATPAPRPSVDSPQAVRRRYQPR